MRRAAMMCVWGASQRAAAKEAVAAYIELGADPSQPGPISAGRGWDFLHAHLEDAALGDDDVVHIELTPRVGGYSARLMRCAVVASPSAALASAAERLIDRRKLRRRCRFRG
jgi:Xaa-Pro aminopeptidase